MKIAGGGAGGNGYTRGPTDTDTKYENGFIIYFVEFYQINVILFSLSVRCLFHYLVNEKCRSRRVTISTLISFWRHSLAKIITVFKSGGISRVKSGQIVHNCYYGCLLYTSPSPRDS